MVCVATRAAEARGLISVIAPDAVVAVGDHASGAERQAAALIAQALRSAGGPADNLRSAEAIDRPEAVEEIGRRHVIVVGTVASNPALRHYPGQWFLDRDAYYAGVYAGGYDPAQGQPRQPVRTWQPVTGFFVGGFGTFRSGGADVGYIECDRSEYFMQARSRAGDAGKPAPARIPLRLMVRVTGSSPAGVLAAARAFVNNDLLCGVVTVRPLLINRYPWFRAQKRTGLALRSADLALDLPVEAPRGVIRGTQGRSLTYLGWVMADAAQYDGFLQQTGVAAARMWRVKYIPETGITNFLTSPHRMNTVYELLIVDLPLEQDRAAVLKALKATQPFTLAGKTFAQTPATRFEDPGTRPIAVASGTHVLWNGNRLYLESLPPDHEALLLDALAPKLSAVPGGGGSP
jgi:hypothetical protein